jgi:hypothetical protein
MKINLSHMDDKTARVLAQRGGAAEILGNLADIPSSNIQNPAPSPTNQVRELGAMLSDPACRDEAQRFIDMYGPLTPESSEPIQEVLQTALKLRRAWIAQKPAEYLEVNQFINEVLSGRADSRGLFPALQAYFETGRFELIPRTLLEVLIAELMHSRRRLKRCERPECQRHFVKQHARHRYCSGFCSDTMRSQYLKDWQAEHSAELKEKRAKRRKYAKRNHR